MSPARALQSGKCGSTQQQLQWFLTWVRQGSRNRHYSPVHTPLSVTQTKFSPLVLVVTSSLAAADHATLLGFDVCAAGNLVVDLWLLWLYVICDFLLIFQSLHTYYVEQKKKVVGRIQYGFTCIKEQRKYILKISYFIFPITKGSVNALMELAGCSTSNKVKSPWATRFCHFDEMCIVHILPCSPEPTTALSGVQHLKVDHVCKEARWQRNSLKIKRFMKHEVGPCVRLRHVDLC